MTIFSLRELVSQIEQKKLKIGNRRIDCKNKNLLLVLTSLWRPEAALPRDVGSRARSVVNRQNDGVEKCLKNSSKLGL